MRTTFRSFTWLALTYPCRIGQLCKASDWLAKAPASLNKSSICEFAAIIISFIVCRGAVTSAENACLHYHLCNVCCYCLRRIRKRFEPLLARCWHLVWLFLRHRLFLELFFICVSFIAGFNLYPLSWNCLPPFLEVHVTGCTWLDAFSIVINVTKCPGLKLGTFNVGISVCFCVVLCVCLFVFLIKSQNRAYCLTTWEASLLGTS